MSTNHSHVLIIQERNAGHTPQVQYTRGLDLSGTIEGAGGIGGLLRGGSGVSPIELIYEGGCTDADGHVDGSPFQSLRRGFTLEKAVGTTDCG